MRGLRVGLALLVALAASYALWVGALKLTATLRPAGDASLRGAILGLNVDATRILVAGVGIFMSALHLVATFMMQSRGARAALAGAVPLALVPLALDFAIARAVDRAMPVTTHATVWVLATIAMTAIAWTAVLLMRDTAPPPPPARPVDPGRTNLG